MAKTLESEIINMGDKTTDFCVDLAKAIRSLASTYHITTDAAVMYAVGVLQLDATVQKKAAKKAAAAGQ
jgi:hypothetical protein